MIRPDCAAARAAGASRSWAEPGWRTALARIAPGRKLPGAGRREEARAEPREDAQSFLACDMHRLGEHGAEILVRRRLPFLALGSQHLPGLLGLIIGGDGKHFDLTSFRQRSN